MSGQLDAALASARRGFRVFPVIPYGKRPAIEDFPTHATTDEATIRGWWNVNPQYNHGIATNDMVVVDVDTRLGGLDNFYANGGHFDTLVVQSPTGGYHAYFDGPNSGLRVNMFPGVDIRSNNGYVLGPGSYTDLELTDDDSVKATGYYTVVGDKPIPWVPLQIEQHLRPPGTRAQRDDAAERDTPEAIAAATEYIQRALPAIEGQGGDNHTYQVAAKMVRDYALSVEMATDLMLLHWNDRCVPPWNADELKLKVQNAEEYGQSGLGGALPGNVFKGVAIIPQTHMHVQSARDQGVHIGNALDLVTIPPRAWLAQRLLLRGDVTVLAATGAAGKSITQLTIAAHYAVGKDFGPYRLARQGTPIRTLMYNAEDDRLEQSRRLAAVCHIYNLDYNAVRANIAFMDDSQQELLLVAKAQHILATNSAALEYLKEAVLTDSIDLIMLDPLVNLHTASENDNSDMRYMIGVLRRLARDTNTAVFVAHHTGKGGKQDKGDADAIRGAGAIVNSARIAIMLSGATDEDRRVYGIREQDRYAFTRIDDAKANMFQKSADAVMWLKWTSAKLQSGDVLGVPVATDMDASATQQALHIAETLHTYLVASGRGSMNRAEAVRALCAEDEIYRKMCEKSDMPLRRLITKVLSKPVPVGGEFVGIHIDGKETLIKVV